MGYTILVVEDSKLISDNLKKSLEADGHRIEQAFDFESSIGLIQSNRFDYILLDLILPDGEGEMLLPYIKRTDARVIVMTTDRDSFRRDRLFGFGIVDYIIKDRYFDDIIENVRKILYQVESNGAFTLLIADDSNFIRNNLQLLLNSRGFLVLTAANGQEAYEMMEKYRVDGLIADLEMPVMDGLSLMGKIRRKNGYRNLPIMILTGSSDSNKIAKVIKHDVKDLIRKPYVIEEVLLKIDNMMNELRQNRVIAEERQKFDRYHEAIINSTLYMKFSPSLAVKYMNERLSALLFGEGGEFCPVSLKDLIKNPTLDLFRSLQKLTPDAPPIPYIFIVETKSRSLCYLSATLSGIFDTKGGLVEIVCIGHDITQHRINAQYLEGEIEKQTQINLEQQQIMFNQAKMAAMGEMIGNIAHQWRQPLNTLGLLVQDLEDAYTYGELDERYLREMSEKSMNQIQFMSKTIDDFRNFYQPNKKKEWFDVAEAVRKTVDIIGTTLQNYHIHLQLVEAAEKRFLVEGYRNELQQVILNLINNAKDAVYAHRGDDPDVEKWIRISVFRNEEGIIVTIEDNGGGVPPGIMGQIFEPYYTTKAEGNGTGIGLYMSKMIIEQNMGGRLEVRNHPLGACFTIVFPLRKIQERGDES